MNQLFLTAKTNLFSKLWKQFGSFSSKKEREYTTVIEKRFPYLETQDGLTEDDGLRWDQYGNPYMSSNF
jgi:hypothetical protein